MKTGAALFGAMLWVLTGAAGSAWAQEHPAPPPSAPPTHVDPKGCAPGERLQQGTNRSGDHSPQSTTGENLSDKLARTDGVLCPPNMDPDIRQPAPGGGKTPVIPPPGSPGGDPSVQPK